MPWELQRVVEHLKLDSWVGRQPIWLPLLNLLPALRSQELWAPYSSGYLEIEAERIQRWSTLFAAHSQQTVNSSALASEIPAMKTRFTREADPYLSKDCSHFSNLLMSSSSPFKKALGANSAEWTTT